MTRVGVLLKWSQIVPTVVARGQAVLIRPLEASYLGVFYLSGLPACTSRSLVP